jgi:hypothetical protein
MSAEKTSARTSDETHAASGSLGLGDRTGSGSGSLDGPSAAASTTAEKAPAPKAKRGLFGRKSAPEPTTYSEKMADQALDVNPESKTTADVQPVSFSSMFRYLHQNYMPIKGLTFIRFATKFELFLNFIGLIAAAAGGAAQVSILQL